MLIRSFQPEDQPSIVQLWQRAGLTRPWNDPDLDIQRKLSVPPETSWFLVGEVDQQIVASVMVGYEGHRGWINYLAVDPDFRRQGLGRQLMEAAEQLLVKAGCPKVNLQVRADNAKAISFYQQVGFNEDAVVSFGKRLISDD